MPTALVEAAAVRKHFPIVKGVLFARTVGVIRAVDGVSFAIGRGETLGLVGESGCGKTTTARLLLRLERPTGGRILFEGKDVAHLSGGDRRAYRAAVQAVFQDPWSSLNPRMRVGAIVAEPIEINEPAARSTVRARVSEVLAQVGLRPTDRELYPHEFSGGQRQRIAIARALTLRPRLIVLDEPVSALDVSIRAQVINLLKDLQEQYGLSYLLIAHDLSTVWTLSDRVGVMYLGRIVELAGVDDVLQAPLHPYTKALLSAALPRHPRQPRAALVLPGEVPSPVSLPAGCRFHPRCPAAMPVCSEVDPPLREVAPGHWVACHLY
jgi:oligopeptide/dipeptide ABC transporter ATP-binding protein